MNNDNKKKTTKTIPAAALRWICPPSKTPSTESESPTTTSSYTRSWQEMKEQIGKDMQVNRSRTDRLATVANSLAGRVGRSTTGESTYE